MTLNITLVNEWGVWQSSDNRLTNPRTGKLVTDTGVKHLTAICPNGAVLITYSGVGRVWDTHLSDWLRRAVRGRILGVMETVELIEQQASQYLGPGVAGKYCHTFSIGGFLAGYPIAFEIGNWPGDDSADTGRPAGRFRTCLTHYAWGGTVLCSGARDAVGDSDRRLLSEVVFKRPKRPEDFMHLLAAVNKRAAKSMHGLTISESCITTFMPPRGIGSSTKVHGWPAKAITTVPMLVEGIDLTDQMAALESRLVGDAAKLTDEEFTRLWDDLAQRGTQRDPRLTEVQDHSQSFGHHIRGKTET